MTTAVTDAIFTCEGYSESIDGSPSPSKRAEDAKISMQLAFSHYLILLKITGRDSHIVHILIRQFNN